MIRDNPVASLWAAIAGVAVLFLGVTAAIGMQRTASNTTGRDPATAASAELTVQLSEFAITPDELHFAAGQPVTVTVANIGQAEHDLTLAGGPTSGIIAVGEAARLRLSALEAGSYRLYCSLPGHADAGMTAALTVGKVDTAAPQRGHDVARMRPDEMARMHEAGVADFPVETTGVGGQPLEPRVDDDGTKVFELTASQVEWETEPGTWHTAYAYNGTVPGPQIDVTLGDRVRVVLHNELSEPTSLHFHGLVVPNDMDGVPGLNQESVMPGDSFTYEFDIRNAGSHMYHSHFDSAKQVPMGLLGAFVVHDPADAVVDVDMTMVLNDGPLGYTLNGKGFPATAPVAVPPGARIRIRYMNEGLQIHPMHLHGMPQLVIARDGYPLAQPYTADTVTIAPGERIDVLVDATEPGAWAWHCHILNHAEGPDGMLGMVTALIVD